MRIDDAFPPMMINVLAATQCALYRAAAQRIRRAAPSRLIISDYLSPHPSPPLLLSAPLRQYPHVTCTRTRLRLQLGEPVVVRCVDGR